MESETEEPQGEGAQAQPEATAAQEVPVATVDTPVAKPVPARPVLTRRLFILGGFWSTIGLAMVGLLGPSLDFAYPRKGVAGAARDVFVSSQRIPAPGDDPVAIAEGRFFLLNLKPGPTTKGEDVPERGGLLALWRKCPHLGCTVPWRPDFTFLGSTGWFRCPCHGSTYTKEGGILVAGPAPRPMDTFPLEVREEVQDDGTVKKTIVVSTGLTVAEKGGSDNPSRVVEYDA